MAKNSKKDEQMITNVTLDTNPGFPEDVKVDLVKEETKIVSVKPKGDLKVGDQVKIIMSSFKNLIGRTASVVDIVEGAYILDINGGKYQFAAEDIVKA